MKQRRPNILWICTDQQRFDTLGCYGNEFVNTPNIDRLAEEGFLFERAYSQSPVCTPSRASFLTGRYPRTCRTRQNGQDIPESERLVTALLRDEGYVCGLSGKLHLSACHPPVCPVTERRIDDGYDDFHWSHHPAGLDTEKGWLLNDYGRWLQKAGVNFHTPDHKDSAFVKEGMPAEHSQSHWCTDKALDFMKTAAVQDKPWLFSINYFDPHHHFDPPLEYLKPYLARLDEIPMPDYREDELAEKNIFQQKDHKGAYEIKGNYPFDEMSKKDHRLVKAAYWAMVDQIDFQVGRMLDYLEESGQRENTIIIFTSDHGELLGDHGIYLKGCHFYDCSVHVPLIVSLPEKLSPAVQGTRLTGLTELIDLAPTLLELTDINLYKGMQGQSLLPFMAGKEAGRSDVYCENYNANINHTDPKAYGTMVFDGRYKLVRFHGEKGKTIGVPGELYDLKSDPGEHRNLWNDPDKTDVKIMMLERLADRMAQTIDPLPIRRACW